jgi:putative ribosome biogenesis GTPase RsgA
MISLLRITPTIPCINRHRFNSITKYENNNFKLTLIFSLNKCNFKNKYMESNEKYYNHQKVVIFGESGTGKSSFVQKLRKGENCEDNVVSTTKCIL